MRIDAKTFAPIRIAVFSDTFKHVCTQRGVNELKTRKITSQRTFLLKIIRYIKNKFLTLRAKFYDTMKNNSPYTAAITGGGFLFQETLLLLPLLQSENRVELLKEEKIHNNLLMINAEQSRKKAITEIARRYDAMPVSFWDAFMLMTPEDQQIANFFVILKTYKICFDFHINVTLRRWNSISKSVSHDDLMMEFNEISANDDFVDSWSETTKKRVSSAYLTALRKVGLLDKDDTLHSITCSNFDYYIIHGEQWFLEACLLEPYQIENIKRNLL